MLNTRASNSQDSSQPSWQPRSFVNFSRVLFALAIVLGDLTACASQQAKTPAPLRCPLARKTIVSPSKPTVHVSYTEPTVNSVGAPLKTLAKTTIYYDFGNGRVPAKEIPASRPNGGGDVRETVAIPLTGEGEQTVFICVTATDTAGHESSMIP